MAGAFVVGRLVATLGLNTSAFQAGANAATKTMMLMGRTMTRFVTLPMALAGGAAIKTQKDFEASMTKINGLVGVSKNVVDSWSKSVLEMAKTTGRGPEELADALYFVASAGIRGSEALDVLEMSAKASAAGLGETKVVADLVTSAMNAYGKENLSAAQATDILVAAVREGKAEADALAGAMGMVLPIASSFGVSFDQVGAAFAGMTRTGTSARVAATQLKAILSSMASPSQESEKAMAKYNYSAAAFKKTIREDGLIAALLELKTVTNGNADAMAEIFPNIRGLMGVLDLLGSNMEYNVQIFESLKNASGSLERAFEAVGGTTQQKLNVAMATLKTTFVQAGEALKPFVVDVLAAFNDKLNMASKRLAAMGDLQKRNTKQVAALAAAWGPLLIVVSRMITIIRAAKISWGSLVSVMLTVGAAIYSYIKLRRTANKVQKESIEQQKKVIANAEKEVFAVRQLFEQLESVEQGTEEWNKIRNQINSSYGSYLTNLLKEKAAHEDVAKALDEVIDARRREALAKGYSDEVTRLMEGFANDFSKKMQSWIVLVEENQQELKEKTGRTPVEFTTKLQKGMDEAAKMLKQGTSVEEINNYMMNLATGLYDDFIGQLSVVGEGGVAKRAGKAIGAFLQDALDTVDLRLAAGERVNVLEDLLKGLAGKEKVEVDVTPKIKALDDELATLKANTDEYTKQEYLIALIANHTDRNQYLKDDELAKNKEIIAGYQTQLEIEQKRLQSLGAEAKLEADIASLQKDREKLSGDALTKNSRAIDAKKRELDILRVQTSALNDQAKAFEMLRIHKEELSTLSGKALEDAIKQYNIDELDAKLGAIAVSGLNAQQQNLEQIAAYKAYGLTLTGKEKDENDEIVKGLEHAADIYEEQSVNAGRLAQLKAHLVTLENELKDLSDDAAKSKQKEIDDQNILIKKEEDYISGLNEIGRMEHDLLNMREALTKAEGKSAATLRDQIYQQQLDILNKKQQEEGLTLIEQKQLEILEIELKRAREANPALLKYYNAQLEALQAQKTALETGTSVDIQFNKKGSLGWFKAMKEEIANAKSAWELAKTDFDKGLVDKEAVSATRKAYQALLGERLNVWADYAGQALGAVSQFTDAMAGLFEAQKQRELSAAGDNAKKREEIEKKYYQKQKRWAIASAIVGVAQAVINAMKTEPFFPMGLIMAGIAAAAGAVQIATIAGQSFAKGGVVYGETMATVGDYPGASTNPEVIAPLSDLKKIIGTGKFEGLPKVIELRLKGRDAVAMIDLERLLQNTY